MNPLGMHCDRSIVSKTFASIRLQLSGTKVEFLSLYQTASGLLEMLDCRCYVSAANLSASRLLLFCASLESEIHCGRRDICRRRRMKREPEVLGLTALCAQMSRTHRSCFLPPSLPLLLRTKPTLSWISGNIVRKFILRILSAMHEIQPAFIETYESNRHAVPYKCPGYAVQCVYVVRMRLSISGIGSGLARALAEGVKLVMEGPPNRMAPSQKWKVVVFRQLYFRRAPRRLNGLHWTRDGSVES